MPHTNPYTVGLDKNLANYTPLTPTSFLERAARVYPDRIAIIHGDWQATWKETYARCRRLASALSKRGISKSSVREHHAGLQSLRSMRRIEARRRKASALQLRFSQSLASRRQRFSQAMVRSTIQRFGRTTNPFA